MEALFIVIKMKCGLFVGHLAKCALWNNHKNMWWGGGGRKCGRGEKKMWWGEERNGGVGGRLVGRREDLNSYRNFCFMYCTYTIWYFCIFPFGDVVLMRTEK